MNKADKVMDLKSVLSDLYGGLSEKKYGDRYVDLQNMILDEYKSLDRGRHPKEVIADLLRRLNQETLENLYSKQANPEIMSKTIKILKSKDMRAGVEKTYNYFIF